MAGIKRTICCTGIGLTNDQSLLELIQQFKRGMVILGGTIMNMNKQT